MIYERAMSGQLNKPQGNYEPNQNQTQKKSQNLMAIEIKDIKSTWK